MGCGREMGCEEQGFIMRGLYFASVWKGFISESSWSRPPG